ncbi:MAG: beta strand repeat-containing protein, partial [Bacteroidota bacterium]
GLTSPVSKLHITTGGGQFNTIALRLEGDYTSGGNYQQFDFSRNADGAPVTGFRSVFDVGGLWSLDFYGSNSGSAFNQHILRMQGDGKVGIGTSSPVSALDVVGNVNLSGAISLNGSTGTNGFLLSSTGTGPSQWIDPNNILPSGATAWTKSGSVIFNTSLSDNIGIGTSSPGKLLGADRYLTLSGTDLGTSNLTASFELVGNIGTTNTMASKIDLLGLDFTSAVIPRARVEARSGNGVTLAGQLLFYTNSNGSAANLTERMRIREGGEVGIGTSGVVGSLLSIGASNQFQVSSTGNLVRVNNVAYSWPAANASGFLSNNGSGTLSWSSAGILAGGTSSYIPKWTSASSLSSTSLLFDNGTTVGINTATPSASSKLHVVGSGNGSTLLVDDNSITNGSVLYLSSTATTGTASSSSRMITIDRSGANANASHIAYGLQSTITNSGTTSTNIAGFFSASGATNNYAIIVPSTGGRVGFGTTTPSHPLTISSNTGGATLQSIRSFATSAFGNSLAFQKGRGTESSPVAVNSGDGLGYIDFFGHNSINGSMQLGASIFAEAAQTFTVSNAAGSNLVFSTAPLSTSGAIERMTVYYNGAVGIGTTSAPATAKLKVEGDVEIPATNEYTYSAAKTKYFNVSPATFSLYNISTSSPGIKNMSLTAGNAIWINGGTLGTNAYFNAPIFLPEGAFVNNLELYVWDNDATYDANAVLYRVTGGSSTATTICTTTNSVGASAAVQTVSGIGGSTVGPSDLFYIRVRTVEEAATNNLRIYGARVTYTITKSD